MKDRPFTDQKDLTDYYGRLLKALEEDFDQFARGEYDVDPIERLESARQEAWRRGAAMTRINLVASAAGEHADVVGHRGDAPGKGANATTVAQVRAHWQLVHMSGAIREATARKNLNDEVTKKAKAVLSRIKKAGQEWKEADELLRAAIDAVSENGHLESVYQDYNAARNRHEKKKEELLKLISAGETERFNPERDYLREWENSLEKDRRRGFEPAGEKIKALRDERDWSQRDLVTETEKHVRGGVALRTVGRAEKCKKVDKKTLQAIADAFGVELDDLLRASGDPQSGPGATDDAGSGSADPGKEDDYRSLARIGFADVLTRMVRPLHRLRTPAPV